MRMVPLPVAGIIPNASKEVRTRVLIIDDEPLVRWSLAAGLRLAGFDVATASSGAEALALSGEPLQPNVVLLGLSLNNTDPGAVLDVLRHAAPRCRVVLMTTASHDMPLPFGGVVSIRKPFDLTAVVRLVDAVVAGSPGVMTAAPAGAV
jgi:two-component system OmpR family response regulator